MKILFVTPYFPRYPYDNHGEVVLLLAKEIAQLNKVDCLEVLTPVFISNFDQSYYQLKIYYPEKPLNKIFRVVWLIKNYRKLILKKKFDIINLQWIFPTGLVLFPFFKSIKSKIFITLRGSDVYLRYKIIIFRWILKKILNRCNAVISISHDLQDKIERLINSKVKKYILPSIGIDFKYFKVINKKYLQNLKNKLLIKDKKIILFVGGLKKVKGVDILIKALYNLKKIYQFNDFICILVGWGNYKKKLQNEIKKYGLNDKIIFTGQLKYELLKYYYKCANIFILPSRSEGLGAVLLEALYFKVPVIASNTGGIKDLISHGKNGFLVPVQDYKKIAEYLFLFFKKKIQLEDKNIRDVKKYNYNFMARKTLEIYQRT